MPRPWSLPWFASRAVALADLVHSSSLCYNQNSKFAFARGKRTVSLADEGGYLEEDV